MEKKNGGLIIINVIGIPAIEGVNGEKEWWVNNKRHRDDGLLPFAPKCLWQNSQSIYLCRKKFLSQKIVKEKLCRIIFPFENTSVEFR